MNTTIGLLLISTNKYHQFVQPLIDGVSKYFFVNHPVEVHLFTDDPYGEYVSDNGRVCVITREIPSYRFPFATLYRYKIFNDHKDSFDRCSHLFYSDVDMAFVDFIGDEILPDESQGGLVVTHHPGFYRGGWGSSNCDRKSKAWIPEEQRKTYFAGGFNGGETKAFLSMAKELSENIADDERRGVMAEWHDETHLNAYMSTRNPKKLDPSYCMVEQQHLRERWGIDHFSPKLIALAKDHATLRA